MRQTARINQFGEIVWTDSMSEKIKQTKSLDSVYDWAAQKRISLPLNVQAVQRIAEAAKLLNISVADNKTYGLSLAQPQQLVDYFHLKRLEMSHAEACAISLPSALKADPSDLIKAGIRYAVHVRKCFIADPDPESRMNVAIAAVHQVRGYPCLLVCRKQDIENWQAALEYWLPDSVVRFTANTLPQEIIKGGVVLVKYTELQKNFSRLSQIKFWSAIVDHSEMIKNPDTRRTRLVSHLVHRLNYVFLTTDFPVSLQVSDLLEPLKVIGKYREFEDQVTYLKDASPDPLQQYQTLEEQRRLKNLRVQLRATCMVRRGDDPWLKYQEQVEFIPLSDEVPERFRNVELKSPIHWLGVHKVFGALGWIKRYRETHSAKFVVVTHHQRVGKEIAKQPGADLLYGSIKSPEQRNEIVRRFLKEEDCQVLVLAKDVEMDLGWDFRCIRTIVFVEPPFSPRELKRILESFQDAVSPSLLRGYYLFTQHPLDLDEMARLDLRLERMKQVLDEKSED